MEHTCIFNHQQIKSIFLHEYTKTKPNECSTKKIPKNKGENKKIEILFAGNPTAQR